MKLCLLLTFCSFFLAFGLNNFETLLHGAAGYSARTACQAILLQGRKFTTTKPYIEELEGIYSTIIDLNVNFTGRYVEAVARIDRPRIAVRGYLTNMGCNLDNQKFNIPETKERKSTDNFKVSYSERVQKVIDEQFANKPIKTRAILVLHNNVLVGERYSEEFTKDSVQIGWGMSKSVLSTLVGIRVKQDKMKVTDFVNAREWNQPNDPRKAITVDHLLRMNSGLKFRETVDPESDLMKMLYISKSHANYAASLPLEKSPG